MCGGEAANSPCVIRSTHANTEYCASVGPRLDSFRSSDLLYDYSQIWARAPALPVEMSTTERLKSQPPQRGCPAGDPGAPGDPSEELDLRSHLALQPSESCKVVTRMSGKTNNHPIGKSAP